jgi:acetyl-CoA carboxylase biotin carboxyl carrier protein
MDKGRTFMVKKEIALSIGSQEEKAPRTVRGDRTELMSVAQLQRLVHLLDHSDISEVELNHADEGRRLVLRKLKTPEGSAQISEIQPVDRTSVASSNETTTISSQHHVVAPTVGIFHPWMKGPHDGPLAIVDQRVEPGQVVGTIEALNVLNEVETTVAGRVAEVHIQDGQPVEYGQILITIDSSD